MNLILSNSGCLRIHIPVEGSNSFLKYSSRSGRLVSIVVSICKQSSSNSPSLTIGLLSYSYAYANTESRILLRVSSSTLVEYSLSKNLSNILFPRTYMIILDVPIKVNSSHQLSSAIFSREKFLRVSLAGFRGVWSLRIFLYARILEMIYASALKVVVLIVSLSTETFHISHASRA